MYKETKTLKLILLAIMLNQLAYAYVWEKMDLPGSDYRVFPIAKATNIGRWELPAPIEAKECDEACFRDTKCRAWTYVGTTRTCYLKDRVPSPQLKRSGWYFSGVKADKPPVQDESVHVGQIGVDRPGYDYRSFNLQRADARLCKQACDNEKRCRAWAMTKPDRNNPQAHCWLKDRVPRQKPNSRVTSGIKR